MALRTRILRKIIVGAIVLILVAAVGITLFRWDYNPYYLATYGNKLRRHADTAVAFLTASSIEKLPNRQDLIKWRVISVVQNEKQVLADKVIFYRKPEGADADQMLVVWGSKKFGDRVVRHCWLVNSDNPIGSSQPVNIQSVTSLESLDTIMVANGYFGSSSELFDWEEWLKNQRIQVGMTVKRTNSVFFYEQEKIVKHGQLTMPFFYWETDTNGQILQRGMHGS